VDLSYITRSTYGAWRLARLDPDGMRYFDLTVDGFWRSFMVALYVLPLYLLSRFADFEAYSERGIGVSAFVVGALASYALAWIAFPVAMIFIAKVFELSGRYVSFVIAYNWAQMVQICVLLPFILLSLVLDEPPAMLFFVEFVVFLMILYYQWFVTRTALGAPALLASGVVALDFAISILMRQAVDGLL
jgi:hypothetical protein